MKISFVIPLQKFYHFHEKVGIDAHSVFLYQCPYWNSLLKFLYKIFMEMIKLCKGI